MYWRYEYKCLTTGTDAITDAGDTATGAGGTIEMPIPAVIAAAVAVGTLINLYGNVQSAKSTIRTAEYNQAYAMRGYVENERYWDDYFKNTGYRPLYPVRSGAYYNLGSYYAGESARAGAYSKVLSSIGHVGTAGAYGIESLYGGLRK